MFLIRSRNFTEALLFNRNRSISCELKNFHLCTSNGKNYVGEVVKKGSDTQNDSNTQEPFNSKEERKKTKKENKENKDGEKEDHGVSKILPSYYNTFTSLISKSAMQQPFIYRVTVSDQATDQDYESQLLTLMKSLDHKNKVNFRKTKTREEEMKKSKVVKEIAQGSQQLGISAGNDNRKSDNDPVMKWNNEMDKIYSNLFERGRRVNDYDDRKFKNPREDDRQKYDRNSRKLDRRKDFQQNLQELQNSRSRKHDGREFNNPREDGQQKYDRNSRDRREFNNPRVDDQQKNDRNSRDRREFNNPRVDDQQKNDRNSRDRREFNNPREDDQQKYGRNARKHVRREFDNPREDDRQRYDGNARKHDRREFNNPRADDRQKYDGNARKHDHREFDKPKEDDRQKYDGNARKHDHREFDKPREDDRQKYDGNARKHDHREFDNPREDDRPKYERNSRERDGRKLGKNPRDNTNFGNNSYVEESGVGGEYYNEFMKTIKYQKPPTNRFEESSEYDLLMEKLAKEIDGKSISTKTKERKNIMKSIVNSTKTKERKNIGKSENEKISS